MENGFSQDLINLGGGFMTSGLIGKSDRNRNYLRGSTYMRGRLAALGVIDAGRAGRTLAIFPTKIVETVWRTTAGLSPQEAAGIYQSTAGQWAREHLVEDAEVAGLLASVTQVIEAADVPDDTIFASWRNAGDDLLATDLEKLYWGIVQLRELRGLRHFLALAGNGLTPGLAIILDERQEPSAFLRFAGYDEEESASLISEAGAIADGKQRWEAAERSTEVAFERDLAVLEPSERAALAAAISSAMDGVSRARAAKAAKTQALAAKK